MRLSLWFCFVRGSHRTSLYLFVFLSARSEFIRSCTCAKCRSCRRECHDSCQGPTLCQIPENGSSGKSLCHLEIFLQVSILFCVLMLRFASFRGFLWWRLGIKWSWRIWIPTCLSECFTVKLQVVIRFQCIYIRLEIFNKLTILLMTATPMPLCLMKQQRAQRMKTLL